MAPRIGRTRTVASRRFLGAVVALVLVLGCGPGGSETGTPDAEGSALVPMFEPADAEPGHAEPGHAEHGEAPAVRDDEVDDAPADEAGTGEASDASGAGDVPDATEAGDAPSASGAGGAPAVTTEEADEAAERTAEDERAPGRTEQAAQGEDTSPEVVRSAVTDRQGDTTSPLLGSAPEWADLVGGSVERTGTGDITLTLVLAAEPEPPREGTTMNVAAFHDLTGDGDIDLEVWANWSADGWFPSWRDNLDGGAAYGDDTGIGVRADGPELHLVVPAERFGDTTSWRWSMGLEWGRYAWLGTEAAAHDLAPDEGHVDHGP